MKRHAEAVITVTLNPAVDRTLEVPDFRIGVHAKARLKAVLPAGKGVNVARGLVRLGGRATACAFIGKDEERMFAESLRAEGVEALFCTVAGRTRTNTTILDPEAHTTTHLRETGFEVNAADISALGSVLTNWLAHRPGATVVFAGSLPEGMAPKDFVLLITACAGLKARVFVDTNGPALLSALEARALDTLKPNLEELGECLGRPVSRQSAVEDAAELLDRVRTVLLTLGAEGAFVIRRGTAIGRRCRIADAEVRNTVGCGDAFLAGWLRGEQVSDDPAEALCWAAATGAASAMSETTVGYGLYDVQSLLSRCEQVP